MSNDGQYTFPNAWGRMIFQSAESVLGAASLQTILNDTGMSNYAKDYPPDNMKRELTFEQIGSLFRIIHHTQGKSLHQAVSAVAGKDAIESGQERFGAIASAASAALKVGSPSSKVGIGLKFMARMVVALSDQIAEVEEADDHYLYHIHRCPYCWGWHNATEPVCWYVVSNLAASLQWALGKQFNVTELKCAAMGHSACIFRIDKTPVE